MVEHAIKKQGLIGMIQAKQIEEEEKIKYHYLT